MRVGLIDVDSHNFPNLALMKLSAWHKKQGDDVEMLFPMKEYDRVYMAKVFDYTPDYETVIRCKDIVRGGAGYDHQSVLSPEAERACPDYSLYGIKDVAYGYLSRGCPRNCPYCIVSDMEGTKSTKVADLGEFWNGEKVIKLMDPNLLACPDKKALLQQLVDSRAWIDAVQGFDIRLADDDDMKLIGSMKIKMLHFAWDRPMGEKVVLKKLKRFKELTDIPMRQTRVYVLTNYETGFDYDLYRIYTLRDMGYDPFVMIYEKHELPRGHRLRRLQRWVNNKFIWHSGKVERFEDYNG